MRERDGERKGSFIGLKNDESILSPGKVSF